MSNEIEHLREEVCLLRQYVRPNDEIVAALGITWEHVNQWLLANEINPVPPEKQRGRGRQQISSVIRNVAEFDVKDQRIDPSLSQLSCTKSTEQEIAEYEWKIVDEIRQLNQLI